MPCPVGSALSLAWPPLFTDAHHVDDDWLTFEQCTRPLGLGLAEEAEWLVDGRPVGCALARHAPDVEHALADLAQIRRLGVHHLKSNLGTVMRC